MHKLKRKRVWNLHPLFKLYYNLQVSITCHPLFINIQSNATILRPKKNTNQTVRTIHISANININNPVTYHFQAKSNNSTSTICINRQNQMTFNSPLTTYNPAKSVQSGHEQGQNMNNSALQKLTKPTSNH